VLPSVDNALARIALSYGGKIVAEGNEEALQAVLEPVFKKIALNIDADIDWEEAAYAWFLGALTSAGYGSAEVAVDLGKLYGIWDRDTAGKTLPSYDPVLLEGPGTAGTDSGRPTLPNHAPVALGEPGRTGADTVRPALPEDTAVPFDQPQRQQTQPDAQTPQNTPDTWTADLDPQLQEDTDLDADLWPEEDTAAKLRPEQIRPLYEAALRRYLEGGSTASDGEAPTLAADPHVDTAADSKPTPRPKEQIISELAPKISKPGITPGRATIEAQRLYADVERIFGSNADTVLETFQPGQDPSKFLDGFRNAYLSGKMGSKAALENSTAAAYLTEAQRELSFVLGAGNKPAGGSIPADTVSADIRDRLEAVTIRGTTKLPQGFSAFPEGDALNERIKKVRPDGNKFDVAMHGSPTAVAFGGNEANMSPHLLAEFIRHSDGYHVQDVRLLSCSTGSSVDGAYCFAEELANALGVTAWAPNDLLFVSTNGIIAIGKSGKGKMIPYQPNERGRIK